MMEDEYLRREKFDAVKSKLAQLIAEGWETPKLVACIYDLYQEYIISNEQECELYDIADPHEDYNECFRYWMEMNYENPLLQVI